MLNYARFVSEKVLDFAPSKMLVIEDNRIVSKPYTEERLLQDGYKPVLVDAQSSPAEKEYVVYELQYREYEDHIFGTYNKITPSTEERTQMEINDLKNYLNSTDYIYARCAETGENVEEIYPGVIAARKEARARIQELEG